jgi:GNAT superfamily N-acetyltransferase
VAIFGWLRKYDMSFTILEGYHPEIIGRVTQLHAAYYSKASNFGVEFEAKVATELSTFCLSYKEGRDGMWAVYGEGIEGSIVIDGSHAAADGAHLRWFITSEFLRGKGIGKQLLATALEFADKCGYDKVYLWTFEGLGAARHLYESHGFRLQHEQQGSQWGRVVNEQRFVREKTRD